MIFGSYLYDITTISNALSKLGYTHTILGSELSQIKEIPLSKTLQYPVYVVDGFNRVSRLLDNKPSVIIVCESKSALLVSNVDCNVLFSHYTERELLKVLKSILHFSEPQTLSIKEPTLQEVIDKVTTKSILTDVQTLVNKVNPYDLRKKVHKYIISYLYGQVSYTEITRFLNTASKLQALQNIVSSSEAKNMRSAVLEYIRTKDEEAVSKKFGVHTFEILYIYNSYDRLNSEK